MELAFVENRESELTSYVSLVLLKKNKSAYELASAWLGRIDSPPFPEMDDATDDSVPFWSAHAFVHGSQEIIAGTETINKPW